MGSGHLRCLKQLRLVCQVHGSCAALLVKHGYMDAHTHSHTHFAAGADACAA